MFVDRSRVMFCGDVHGSVRHFEFLVGEAVKRDVSLLVACGDFGFWPHMRFGVEFLERVDGLCERAGVDVLWVDGNHENHDVLDELRGEFGDDAPVATSVRSWWLPRGCVTTVGELSVMGYGGAWSVDWRHRVKGVTWWEQELIDADHVDALPCDRDVDVLVTHETPLSADRGMLSYKDDYWDSVQQRRLMTDVVASVKPRAVFSGHHHVRATFRAGTPEHPLVNVLDRDDSGADSFFVLDASRVGLAELCGGV